MSLSGKKPFDPLGGSKRSSNQAASSGKPLAKLEESIDEDIIDATKNKKKEDSDSEDYNDSDFDDPDSDEKETKEKVLAKKEQIKQVRQYEIDKQKGKIKYVQEDDNAAQNNQNYQNNEELDEFFARIRHFFDDMDMDGHRKVHKDPYKNSNRVQFSKACAEYDTKRKLSLPLQDIKRAFQRARLVPMLEDKEFKRLFEALELFTGIDKNEVYYNQLLEANVKREHNCINGIFPKIKQREASKYEIEAKQKKEEAERQAKQEQEKLQKMKESKNITSKLSNMSNRQKKEFEEKQKKLEEEKAAQDLRDSKIPFNSHGSDIGSSFQGQNQVSSISGMSEIMQKSAQDDKAKGHLVDENENLRVFQQVKEMFMQNFFTFNDLLQAMGRANFQEDHKITFKDFTQVLSKLKGYADLSEFQLQNSFMIHAIEKGNNNSVHKAYIPIKEFKDKFFPSKLWQKDSNQQKVHIDSDTKSQRSETISNTESMPIDNILQGQKISDIQRIRDEQQRKKDILQAEKYKSDLEQIKEERLDAFSQASQMSKQLDQIIDVESKDPRVHKKAKLNAQGSSNLNLKNNYTQPQLSGLTKQQLDELCQNNEYFRQNESQFVMGNILTNEYDKTLDIFYQTFCRTLLDEIEQDNKEGLNKGVDSYVSHYGRQTPGYLNFKEFKDIYVNHVHYADGNMNKPMPQDSKLEALFKVFDIDGRNKISKKDFVGNFKDSAPPNGLIERLSNRIRKAGNRLNRVLLEEFIECDIPYGCNGMLPLATFQTIMIDYDIPFLKADIKELEKHHFVRKDDNDDEYYVMYRQFLEHCTPKQRVNTDSMSLIVRVQAMVRGFLDRKRYKNRLFMHRQEGIDDLQNQISKLHGKEVKQKGSLKPSEKEKAAQEKPKKMSKEEKKAEMEAKKKAAAKKQRDQRRNGESLETKMASIVKSGKESKINEKQIRARQELEDFIKNVVIEGIINKAQCYGESLQVCNEIQSKFESRPVTKYVFPLLQEFQFNVMGVQPKSLQIVNMLGQVMFIDSESQLNQYDIVTLKSLQNVNLGTRPPLKHYPIIDLVCDQTSGRIYTLNANWILEIWNIEQSATFPQKRLAVCTNEGGKDFINLYYKQTFNNSKPKFLCLSESNQQILVVNTSCVDGSIVFIDPISFSVLKKINLRYQDYEIPKKVKACIKQLIGILSDIKQKSGKDIHQIFKDINETDEEVRIRDFVHKLIKLDNTLNEEELYETLTVLDEDGSGDISKKEFLNAFGQIDNAQEEETQKAEQQLQDDMWPEWVFKDQKLETFQQIFMKMYDILENVHSISAEQAFGIYDVKDQGVCTEDEFKRIVKIFFDDLDENEINLLVRITDKTAQQEIAYRSVCRFLTKRFIRTFKNQGSGGGQNLNSSNAREQQSAISKILDQPLTKDASLIYMLRKAVDLDIDLRKVFLEADKDDLTVINRAKFKTIVLDLPLGITEAEFEEIAENDFNYDNSGNVDYKVILNSDLFVSLERKRVLRSYKKRRGVRINNSVDDIDVQQDAKSVQSSDLEIGDNRKVVVEDLIYINDLDLLIYTTVQPLTSVIHITNVSKKDQKKVENKSKIINLREINNLEDNSMANINQSTIESNLEKQTQQSNLNNHYQLLAKLRGHRNTEPPCICYIPQSGCLISGEKHLSEISLEPTVDSYPRPDDPNHPTSHQFNKSKQGVYERFANKNQDSDFNSEILIWNLQRDMIELFQSRPPWTVPCHFRFNAHSQSIIDICYMPKSQLLVTASTDKTIRFFDPVSQAYDLIDPNNHPHAQQKPGYFTPLQTEKTKKNATFKEVKRIYTGSEASCYALKCLNISNIVVNSQQPDLKSQIEWLVGLKLGKPQMQGKKNTQVGFICGYGIERVCIEVQAKHHDDVIPAFVMKECEELIQTRRKKLVSVFQSTLPHTISKIYSEVSLQNSYIQQIRKLFLHAILNRKDLKYVNPEPLRQIYEIILKLPNRNKFQSFLSSTGCSDKLSVSETFFYLQIFNQIHPLRTTQIEFGKKIQEFYNKHQRQFLRGVKRWPKASSQKFANFIRNNGIDLEYLQMNIQHDPRQNSRQFSHFCTRERFIQYFQDNVVSVQAFSEEEIDSIMNELDPYYTGVVQIKQIQNHYWEEITFFKQTNLNRPKEIMEDIRSKVFPNKRLALQQSLISMDKHGDGYINKEQFVQAFLNAQVDMSRDTLEFLFDMMSEKYNTDDELKDSDKMKMEELTDKVLNITFFQHKLFNQAENREINEVDQTLTHIKAALIYKGLDFSVIFAEHSEEQQTHKRKQRRVRRDPSETQKKEKSSANLPIDINNHYTRFSQQLIRDEFISRVEQLNAQNVTRDKIQRLSNFLCLNQKNNNIVYLNSWLHSLQRVQTSFQVPDKRYLGLLCSKLLRNELAFRAYVEQIAYLKGKRDEEKFINLADLRAVLLKFGVNYINQNLFLEQITNGTQIHIEDLITKMKSIVKQSFGHSSSLGDHAQTDDGFNTMSELAKTDFFQKVQKELKLSQVKIDSKQLEKKCAAFDTSNTQNIKIYMIINILKHNYPNVFDSETLIGLQYDLERLSYDEEIDYKEFIKFFLSDQSLNGNKSQAQEIKLDKRQVYNMQDYEDLLSKIMMHVKQQGLELDRIFNIFCKQGSFISYSDLKKILDLIEFEYSDNDFDMIVNFQDENDSQTIHAYEFLSQVQFSKELKPVFDINRWIIASRDLNGRYKLLEMVREKKDQIIASLNENHKSPNGGPSSGVISGEEFQDLIRTEVGYIQEHDLDLLTMYAIKGSRRVHGSSEGAVASSRINIQSDLIQYKQFDKAIDDIIFELQKQDKEQKEKMRQKEEQENELAKFRRAMDKQMKKQQKVEAQHQDANIGQRRNSLIQKVINLCRERNISLFDCFTNYFDPLNRAKSIISISLFKNLIQQLNMPLTVQDQRILRRMADPQSIGKVDVVNFCHLFETPELKSQRLNGILEKLATAFYLQNFNLRRAFNLFDQNNDGKISAREFTQGFLNLNLGLRLDEIDDLMQMVDQDNNGYIHYDEFISTMDINMQSREKSVLTHVEDQIFKIIKSYLTYQPESLYEIMQSFDINNTGVIDASVLPQIFKRIGVYKPDAHMKMLMQAGGYQVTDKKIDYIEFQGNLQKSIDKRLGLLEKQYEKVISKLYAIMQAKKISVFDLFTHFDVNFNGRVCKLELKTGIQQLGLFLEQEELESLWRSMHKQQKYLKNDKTIESINEENKQLGQRSSSKGNVSKNHQVETEFITYQDFLQAFIRVGCLKIQKSVDRSNNLMNKFRQQLKNRRLTVEKAYQVLDYDKTGFVFKDDFMHFLRIMNMDFNEEEALNIFEKICEQNSRQMAKKTTDQQEQAIQKPTTNYQKFTQKQLSDAVLVQRDENWIYQSYIKIHGVVLQKNLSYKRMFTQWRDKNSKSQPGRLNKDELMQGLKRMKAGLTQDEIQKLCSSISYEGKDQSFGYADFEKLVVQGAKKLENDRAYQKLLLVEWITKFNDELNRGQTPLEKVVEEFDIEAQGTLKFEDFQNLNDYMDVDMPKKNLKKIFDIIDGQKKGRISLEDIRKVSCLSHDDDDAAKNMQEEMILSQYEDENTQAQQNVIDRNSMKVKQISADQIRHRNELQDIYVDVKNSLEAKSLTLEQIIFSELKFLPDMLQNKKGIQQIFEKLNIILSEEQADQVLQDVRKANQGIFECSYRDFIDFMTRRRINVAFLDKGFVDPLIAKCCVEINKIKDGAELTFENMFNIFDGMRKGHIQRDDFLRCVQGLEMSIAVEDLMEFFNYLDDKMENRITKLQFVDALTFIITRMSQSQGTDQNLNKSIGQLKKGINQKNRVSNVLKLVCESISKKKLTMRQVMSILNVNKTGFVSRSDLSQVMRMLCDKINIDQSRMLIAYFDPQNLGKISTNEVAATFQEILNQQIGGGFFAFMQVQPIINKIINQLAIDCDKFFDIIADKNEHILQEEAMQSGSSFKVSGKQGSNKAAQTGLDKRLFFNQLAIQGVQLNEQEKSLLSSVFTLKQDLKKFNYTKLDQAFEGEQQTLYEQEKFYTVEWERRIFRKIGDYLMRNNYTIHKCFDLIDQDNNQNISLNELRQAIIRFELNLTDIQLKNFLKRLSPEGKEYITKEQFVKRFWSAYTYEEVILADQSIEKSSNFLPVSSSTNVMDQARRDQAVNGTILMRIQKIKMFMAIQARMKSVHSAKESYIKLDSGVGFLVLKDFQLGFSEHFDLTLKNNEVKDLFIEIDSDSNGIVMYQEFETFYNTDYNQQIKELNQEKEQRNTQYDIFDHLMKMLSQKNMSLEDMFEQIDLDKNGFIEVDEFHDMLERIGFIITQAQVFQLMRQMDDNFDGRISFNEMRNYILKLGFTINKTLESKHSGNQDEDNYSGFQWRDKGIEVVIRSLKDKLDKVHSYDDYFKSFDVDHDNHLTPTQFRTSLMNLKQKQLKKYQIDRILHILIEEKKQQPLISIERIQKFLLGYQYLGESADDSLLIDQDLFVYIVEKYDGFSRLVEQFQNIDEKSQYLSRHVHEMTLRGMTMLSNQKTVQKIGFKIHKMNELYEQTMILLAAEANRLLKSEAQLLMLDPTTNINTIVSDQNIGVLNSIDIPNIENSAFDIDQSTLGFLPSGAQQYTGIIPISKKKVEILVYPNEALSHVSLDGKSLKKHLNLELQVHRYLHNMLNEDDEAEVDMNKSDIFPNFGRFQKKIGIAANDTEIYVINDSIDSDEWLNLEDFVTQNGGILNIPLFYHTDAPLFIIRHWAKMILQIISKVQDISIVLRCLHLKQIWVSRDGQRIKLGHVRGVGKVNNLGYITSCPDIYLNLENNMDSDYMNQSSTISPGQHKVGAASSSKKTEGQRSFSNRCLDNPFIAPEILFQKFQDHSSALDVWSFGMIIYCILFGKKPESFYATYKRWYRKSHDHDIELGTLPFIPPSTQNFLYDPFSIDFDNPFDEQEYEMSEFLDIQGSLSNSKKETMNFDNFIKCLKDLSYSSLFQSEDSKKFYFKSIGEQIKSKFGNEQASSQVKTDEKPRFPGQQKNSKDLRLRVMANFAKMEILERKNELGLILDLISSCLDLDPKKRPTINGLLNSPLFQLDSYEMTNAVRFSQNVILYRSPVSTVSMRITGPLRKVCYKAIKDPMSLFLIEEDILKLFAYTEDCIAHVSSLPIDQINDVLTENEKRKSLLNNNSTLNKKKDTSQLRVSPNSPLCAQIIEDKVFDMLIFICLRYTKYFNEYKQKRVKELEHLNSVHVRATQAARENANYQSQSRKSGMNMTATNRTGTGSSGNQSSMNYHELQLKQAQRMQNLVLQRMSQLLKILVYEMHSYNTPMSPFVKQVIDYIVKFFIGEEHELGSDYVLRKTSGIDSNLKDYLRGRSFYRREAELCDQFKSDYTDKSWHQEQKNLEFLDKSNHWTVDLHKEALKIFKDAITESGMGQSCYPVINDYITNVTNSFESTQIFSKQMNHLCLSFLIPMNRTAAYYNEMIPISECLARLYSPDLEKAGKRCALAMIRSVFQTGNSDKIKACLDMRVPKHIIHFLQDSESEIRKECLLTFYEISKGLQDEDFEIMGKNTTNIQQEFSKRNYNKTAFDTHKAISMAQQSDTIENTEKALLQQKKNQKGAIDQSNTDSMAHYIKRTIALIEKNENEKYINFALDLPNLNFLSCKRFLKEMSICFESPVFIAPLIRLLKTQSETYGNKEIILKILSNLFCGNRKVLIALNSPVCDTYMTLLRILMNNTKLQNARSQPSSSVPAQMRQQLSMQDKVVELFKYMFEQRRPEIIHDLSCMGASSTLLKEQNLQIPSLISLPNIVNFFDEFSQLSVITPDMIFVEDILNIVKDTRCWIKHFYSQSTIPQLTRIKALQRCMNFLIKIINIAWQDYNENTQRQQEYLQLFKACFSLFDWLCIKDHFDFIFNDQSGSQNLDFIIEKCNYCLSQFRHPTDNSKLTMEDLTFNQKANKQVQKQRKYGIFEFTSIGAILQNILYQMVRKNEPYLNQLLSEANYGFIFGEQLLLEYDFMRHCIDNKIESLVLIDSYVKKNEIRLNTYEFLLRSQEHTLKEQFLKSNFVEKLFLEYLMDFREFDIQFSAIDLEFLAFRKSFPLRLECISIINTTLMLKLNAPSIFTELIMYSRRHFMVRNEINLLQRGKMSSKESTSLLLFSVIMESNDEDLLYIMMQEGAHKIIREIMKEYPSMNKRFPILSAFTNKF